MLFEQTPEYLFGREEAFVKMPWLREQFAFAPKSAVELAPGAGPGQAPRVDGAAIPDWHLILKGPLRLPVGTIFPESADTIQPVSLFVDAKSKDKLTLTYITGTIDTGFNEAHWNDYRQIQSVTKEPVFLSFIHPNESEGIPPFISFDSLDRLSTAPWRDRSGKLFRGPRKGNFTARTPGVFWPHSALTRIPLAIAGRAL